jgi:hypothetical protein
MASALARTEPLLSHPDSLQEMCVWAKRWWPSLLCGGHEPSWMALYWGPSIAVWRVQTHRMQILPRRGAEEVTTDGYGFVRIASRHNCSRRRQVRSDRYSFVSIVSTAWSRRKRAHQPSALAAAGVISINSYSIIDNVVWVSLKNFIPELRVGVDSISEPLLMYCDNQLTIFYSSNNK